MILNERNGGFGGYWRSEAATPTNDTPSPCKVTLKLSQLCAAVYLTQELIDDGGTEKSVHTER